MIRAAEAEFGIRQLQARYCDAVWRQDVAAFVDCFTSDGEWKIAGRHLKGREQIGAGFVQFTALSERVLMFIGAPVLEVGEGSATARTPATELIKLRDGRGVRTIGIYYEWLADEGDRWRFQRRHWSLQYYGAPDLSDPFQPSNDYGAPPGMPALDEPTIVRAASAQ